MGRHCGRASFGAQALFAEARQLATVVSMPVKFEHYYVKTVNRGPDYSKIEVVPIWQQTKHKCIARHNVDYEPGHFIEIVIE